ncbi:hypothetical protein PTHTG4_33480 [Parageobacillus thermoglucosidasius]|nr:hypothetical protein PTHTG4_33480 [Parageobacillus thermoglucosidasius]
MGEGLAEKIPFEIANQINNPKSNTVALSQLEQEILMEVANGLYNKDIAKKHHISQRSVERHLSRIFTKLHVSSRLEAVEKGKKLGLIPEFHLLSSPLS